MGMKLNFYTMKMKMKNLLSLVTIFQISKIVISLKNNREKLLNDILIRNDYNHLVRPTRYDDLTYVDTQLKILQIDLDEKYQQLISTVWFEMIWNDSRISWDPKNYGGINEITIPVNKIWVPDIVLQNGIGHNDYLKEFQYFNPWISSYYILII
jgi:nicotinic acetylcholine receptor, invertebrate